MVFVIFLSLTFTAAGIIVTAAEMKKDYVQQGLYGHVAFYLYLLAVAPIIFGTVVGLSSGLWNLLVFFILGWLILGRVLTFMRLFKQLSYLHLIGGILTFILIIVITIVQFLLGVR